MALVNDGVPVVAERLVGSGWIWEREGQATVGIREGREHVSHSGDGRKFSLKSVSVGNVESVA